MYGHHSFSPSALEHSPRPAEREIRVKAPAQRHDGRTLQNGEEHHG